jgi:hypothetical protein
MPPCLPLTGSKRFPPLCFLSTGGLHRPFITVFPIIFFIARCQITHSFEFLVACAIQTSVPRLPTNCLLTQQRVFLGYPPSQKGYRCLDLSTRKIIISHHVVFDETHFPFAASKPRPDSFDFLLQDILPAPAPSTSDARHTRASVVPASSTSDDAGDPVGLDPAILWHGAAYPLPQVPRQAAPVLSGPAPPGAGTGAPTPDARPRQRFGLHYSRRPL